MPRQENPTACTEGAHGILTVTSCHPTGVRVSFSERPGAALLLLNNTESGSFGSISHSISSYHDKGMSEHERGGCEGGLRVGVRPMGVIRLWRGWHARSGS